MHSLIIDGSNQTNFFVLYLAYYYFFYHFFLILSYSGNPDLHPLLTH